jgi:hypothetical protein
MANTLKFGNGQWATKEGSTLAYNDEGENFKPLPFNFTRSTSATRVNKDGLIEVVTNNKPRIDFLNDSNGALLLEPQRSNLYTYSNDVSFWSKSNVVTTSNYAISPDGTQNAFRAAFSSSIGLLYVTATGTTGTNNTLSVWAKSNNGSSNKFRFFANGTITLSNDFIATDEWQRFEFTYNCTSVTSGLTGASDSATNDIIFYGFQHEVGSYATSYIPTQGAISTRVADVCNGAGNNQVINSTEGVLYAEIKGFISQDTIEPNRYITITNGTSNERVALLLGGNPNQLRAIIYSSTQSINLSFTTSLADVKQYNKLAVKYKSGDYAFFLNGTKINSSTITNAFSANTLNDLSFDVGGGTQQFRGKVKGLKLYNTALTDQELINLTTI